MAKIDRLGWAAGLATIAYGHRIGVRVSDASALERATACLPPGWKPAARPEVHCMYSLVVGGAEQKVRRFNLLYRGSERIARSHDLDGVYETLEGDLKLHVAAAAPSRVFVHAGVVGWRGGAIVLPGRSFAGKSTLVDSLVRAGATYYSDEYAVLDVRGRVHPFARVLKLRARPGEAGKQAPPQAPERPVGTRPLPVRLVALTHYQPGERWRAQALSPGQALLALMENTVPVRHRPEATLKTLREIVTRAPVIKGVRGEVEEAVERLLSHGGEEYGSA
jgi:hypothetical protein